MPWRFRKSIKLGKHARINVGKRGVSLTTGTKGFHQTIGHGKTRTTVGLPGTGISYTHVTDHHKKKQQPQQPALVTYTCPNCHMQLQAPIGQVPICPRCSQPPLFAYTCIHCGYRFQTPPGLAICPRCGH